MRKKLPITEKRSKIIGIKVTQEVKDKLNYIANCEQETLSTLINRQLEDYIESYFKRFKLKWEDIPPEERGEG